MTSIIQQQAPVAMCDGDFVPMRIVEIELGQEVLPALSATDEQTGKCYRRALCLVRLHTQPLGTVELCFEQEELYASTYLPVIWQTLSEQINLHLQRDGLSPITVLDAGILSQEGLPRCIEEREHFLVHAPFVSVIVPTHDRPERLALCLRSLLALHYPRYEIIVVDNAPATCATIEQFQQMYSDISLLRYVREDRQGPSWARNCGMDVAQGEILVFADDDVVVDPHWLTGLVRPFFLAEGVACVSGLVMPLQLDTVAQFWFEEYGGFQKGFSRRIFDLVQHRVDIPLYPYNAGFLGVGASMAFTTQFLRHIGGFDPVLGGRGPARGGEDLAAFFQVIIRGYKMVYEPAALLYHLHRQDYASLRQQIYNYGVGQTAYLTRNIVMHPQLLFDFLARVPYGLFFLLNARSAKNLKKTSLYPRELTMVELIGMLYGPLAYLQSCCLVRRERRLHAKQTSGHHMSVTDTRSVD